MVLTKREKYIGLAAGGLAVVFGLFWAVTAYGSRRADIARHTADAKQDLDKADYLFERQRKMQTVWTEMQKSGALKTDRTDAGNQLLNALREWTQQAKVNEWTLKGPNETKDGRFAQLTYHVTGSGPQRAVAEFLWRIETAPIRADRAEPRTALYQQLEERLRRVSAIQNVGITTNVPTFGGLLRQLSVDGRPAPAGEKLPDVTMVSISPGYFDTLGVKLQRGRSLTDADGTPGHEAAIVNQRFVTMHFAARIRSAAAFASRIRRPRFSSRLRWTRRSLGLLRPYASAASRIPIRTRWSTFPTARTRSGSCR